MRRFAQEFVNTADGASAPSRAAATERARRAFDALDRRLGDAQKRVGERKNDLRQFVPQDRSLDPYGRPIGIEHGEELIARASGDHRDARQHYDDMRQQKSGIEAQVRLLEDTVRGYATCMEPLNEVSPGQFDVYTEIFAGTVEEAKKRRAKVRSDLTQAQGLLQQAERIVRGGADQLAIYANSEQFASAASPIRRQIISVSREELPRHAADWERSLRPRLRTLTDDLEQIDRHRDSIIERLQGMVQLALGTLRSAQRLSRLPAGLGDWSGQEFLRIKFAVFEETALPERIGEVVDESAAATSKDGSPIKRDGMTLLLRGVRAAVSKGFHVDILKPDAVLRTERLRVSEINDVFSGGQQLTAAIILYCTMAALRANDRGRAHHQHAGVLFLDNPIGRASAGYLLEIQLSVAKALGVQLIYTTGLFDAGALSVFPLLIRLRNDADLRAGMKYLSVEATVRHHLDRLDEPDGIARIDATRVFRRPAEDR